MNPEIHDQRRSVMPAQHAATQKIVATGAGSRFAKAFGFSVLLGIIWAFVSAWIWFGKYFLCSGEPASIGQVFTGLAISWVAIAYLAGWIAYRGTPVWPWSLAWFILATTIFAVVVSSAPAPAPSDCGFGGGW
jgi:hypothetical protein